MLVIGWLLGTSTLYAAIENPEILINSALNFVTVAMLIYRERRFKNDIEPKVNTVVERTEHLDEYDPNNGRRKAD